VPKYFVINRIRRFLTTLQVACQDPLEIRDNEKERIHRAP
jgi:hypothetical protein